MLRGFRFAARQAAAASLRPRRTRTPTPLPAGFVNSQTAITDEALLEVVTDRWNGALAALPPKVIGKVRDDAANERYLIIGSETDEDGRQHRGIILWQKSYAGKVGIAKKRVKLEGVYAYAAVCYAWLRVRRAHSTQVERL